MCKGINEKSKDPTVAAIEDLYGYKDQLMMMLKDKDGVLERLEGIEHALNELNAEFTSFNLKLPNLDPDFEDEGSAEAYGPDFANDPDFKRMFNELPNFGDLVDPITNTTSEQDYVERYLRSKSMMVEDDKLFDVVVELVEELERVKRGE